MALKLRGYITQDGELKIYNMPEDHPVGDVELTVEVPLSSEEIADYLTSHPRPASEIETGGWEELGITDSVEWVAEQRRKSRRNRTW